MKRITLTLLTALTAPLTFANNTDSVAQADTASSNALFPPLFDVQDDTIFGLPSLMSQDMSQEQNAAILTQEDIESKTSKLDLPIADKKTANPGKKWEHALPFFAEDVIMNGYDLPLPFGISIIYANVQQDMTLTDLSVGYGGGPKYDIDFVSFDNTESNTHTPQLKLDAWVLPFMNVFATVGKLTGTVGINFAIDGNQALAQLGTDCSSRIKPPECYLLTDQRLEVEDIEASLTGMSYGAGMMFVGGWNSYFISVPVTFTWTDMDRSDTEGYVVNVLPRVGKQFQFNNGSSLSLYVGTSYLKSQLTLSGSQPIPGTDQSIDYKVEQENVDKWMGLVGGSYNLSKHWMVAFEYGGIGGASRQQFITNLSYRY
ncbi:hypothetical protein FR932_08965 [Moritella marina ATCC 15381]|uniref:Porin family protein n=1 Tax=Moritella marina ATCC 15381 TaxID=1202962 RepID=A0A5J6WNI8_MORMI|nr:hypothetical protein [Moritella marina]QFI37972.1 hypothetical protein FR932_08965 [Moritella marina ATCC 15381]